MTAAPSQPPGPKQGRELMSSMATLKLVLCVLGCVLGLSPHYEYSLEQARAQHEAILKMDKADLARSRQVAASKDPKQQAAVKEKATSWGDDLAAVAKVDAEKRATKGPAKKAAQVKTNTEIKAKAATKATAKAPKLDAVLAFLQIMTQQQQQREMALPAAAPTASSQEEATAVVLADAAAEEELAMAVPSGSGLTADGAA